MNKFDDEDKTLAAFIAVWFGLLAINITFWGVIIWAIIKVVNHFV